MEFNYMILQAYDFLNLIKNMNAFCNWRLDQWGNIVNGVDLIKRHLGKQSYGLTTPLITLATGAKMGKTESGAVWLDAKFLSPYEYWQFWRNTDDRDVIKFLNFFTDLSVNEIEKIKSKNINELKIILANKTTEMLHGKNEAIKSENIAKEAFSENSAGSSLPTVKLDSEKLKKKLSIIELIIHSKLENSKSEIRRLIKVNAIKINNNSIADEKFLISNELFQNNF